MSTFEIINQFRDQLQQSWDQFPDVESIRQTVYRQLEESVPRDDRTDPEQQAELAGVQRVLDSKEFTEWLLKVPGMPEHIHRECVFDLLRLDNYKGTLTI